ncbi:MAG: hypothetical protein J7474_11425, partial [Arthrobacter sp.]|nr:hypothetical protein [Arthrobacter sp.]
LQPDPVLGGSANTYDYANQDSCNNYDLNGENIFTDFAKGVARTVDKVADYAKGAFDAVVHEVKRCFMYVLPGKLGDLKRMVKEEYDRTFKPDGPQTYRDMHKRTARGRMGRYWFKKNMKKKVLASMGKSTLKKLTGPLVCLVAAVMEPDEAS